MDKGKGSSLSICMVLSILLMTCASVLSFVYLSKSNANEYGYYASNLKAGYIADEDVRVISSIDVINSEATQKSVTRAKNSVLPVFTFDSVSTMEMLNSFEKFRVSSDTNKTLESISYDIIYGICQSGVYDSSEIDTAKANGSLNINVRNSITGSAEYIQNISKVITTDNISEYIYSKISAFPSLTDEEKQIVYSTVRSFITVNVHYDDFVTQQRIKESVEKAEVVVQSLYKGDLLIEKDKVITQQQINLLLLLSTTDTLTIKSVVTVFVQSFFCYTVLFLFLHQFVKDNEYHKLQYFILFTLFSLVVVAATYFEISFASKYKIGFIFSCIPVCFLPSLMINITGSKKIGIVSSFVVGVITFSVPGANIHSFMYCLFIGILCSFSMNVAHKRIDSILQYVIFSLISLSFTAIVLFIGPYSFKQVQYIALAVLLNVSISQVLISLLLPILEKLFNLPTNYRMYELSYSETPLLKRLASAAPGTYNHSRQVAELASAAAIKVKANQLIVRVGALYHDVGKTDYPEYFVENQSSENKHDDINPSLSASIIKNHVKLGAEKAKDAGLPQEVIHIVESHHGNDIISFFFNEAKKEENIDVEHVQSTDYSYNAEIPNSKECALVMLADGVEAASRTITEPNPAKFSKVINSIIMGKVERNQLSNSKLTFDDLEEIKQSFLETLTAMYHSRIQYPDEDLKK